MPLIWIIVADFVKSLLHLNVVIYEGEWWWLVEGMRWASKALNVPCADVPWGQAKFLKLGVTLLLVVVWVLIDIFVLRIGRGQEILSRMHMLGILRLSRGLAVVILRTSSISVLSFSTVPIVFHLDFRVKSVHINLVWRLIAIGRVKAIIIWL